MCELTRASICDAAGASVLAVGISKISIPYALLRVGNGSHGGKEHTGDGTGLHCVESIRADVVLVAVGTCWGNVDALMSCSESGEDNVSLFIQHRRAL